MTLVASRQRQFRKTRFACRSFICALLLRLAVGRPLQINHDPFDDYYMTLNYCILLFPKLRIELETVEPYGNGVFEMINMWIATCIRGHAKPGCSEVNMPYTEIRDAQVMYGFICRVDTVVLMHPQLLDAGFIRVNYFFPPFLYSSLIFRPLLTRS